MEIVSVCVLTHPQRWISTPCRRHYVSLVCIYNAFLHAYATFGYIYNAEASRIAVASQLQHH